MNNDIIVRVIDMPLCIKGVTLPSNDGIFNIYINAKYPIDVQLQTLRHEKNHIEHYDFDSCCEIEIIENQANII